MKWNTEQTILFFYNIKKQYLRKNVIVLFLQALQK
jgi:hypothetical protein